MKDKRDGFIPKENLISIRPAVLVGIITLIAIIITAIIIIPPESYLDKIITIVYGAAGSAYLILFYFLFSILSNKKTLFTWVNAIIAGISIGLLSLALPDELDLMLGTLTIVACIFSAVISERAQSYFILISASAFLYLIHQNPLTDINRWTEHLVMTMLAVLSIETIFQLKNLSKQQIKRLEIINEFSKQIVSTLDTKEIFSLLDTTLQNVMKVDSYYIGTVKGDELYLEVFCDEGQYFHDMHLPRKGTLSNWVINHQQELFLPDLRNKLTLEDVELIVWGKEKASLSWMGAPMRGQYVDGIMVIASYKANDFDRSDMELLSNIAQRAALALDNTYQHALVEEEARLDSLTRVLNHGYFVQTLHKQAQTCLAENQLLSLIMLDIDYFKKYNDTYGHVIGDEVLVSLCKVIRAHIKTIDAVGRWGGEEFAISLPNTSGAQAVQVAQRIRETMASLRIEDHSQRTIPSPTVSQGIAVFPSEIKEVEKLIDLSDNRLYIAKERGRDQIEPGPTFWENN
ncbi:MAG: GGDEF domain-containing protein [Chloroflexi bacterium]|nr:GGDEF domain-containing protein [Chloroflexota bacterium]